ncbi:MAG TPA: hypothetical protein VF618_09195 [Thermoanaerobaculia bacterium]
MSKRDILDEILAKKERIGHRELRAAAGLLKIKESLEDGRPDPLSRSLSVVAIVSCVEVATRDAIALLIDSGTPYVERLPDLLKGESRFSVDIVRAFQDRRVSLGEFVAHLLPVSSLPQITGYFDVLLGESIRHVLGSLRIASGYYAADDATADQVRPLVVPDVEAMMRGLAAAFAARHVVAHEAGFDEVSEDDIRSYLAQAVFFDNAIYEYIRQETDPTTYHAVWAETLEASVQATESANRVKELYGYLHDALESGHYGRPESNNAALLQTAQTAFDRYIAAEIDFQLALRTPISGHASRNIETYVEKKLSDERADLLRESLNDSVGWVELVKLRGGV